MLDRVNDFISSTVGNMPLAILTIALLATPTLIYVVYRLAVSGASGGRSRISTLPAALWVCPVCRSVNDPSSHRCYRCDFKVANADDILIIDPITARPITLHDQEPTPIGRPGVAVGPGIVLVPAALAYPSTPAASVPASSGPGVAVGPGVPTAVPRSVPAPMPMSRIPRTASGQTSIGSAVGARRPFDPTPNPAPTVKPDPSDTASPAPGPASSAMTIAAPTSMAAPRRHREPPTAIAPARPTVAPPPRLVVTAARPPAATMGLSDEVGPAAS